MKAIIMAGGEGSRLLPLTEDMPKPMAPIVGKPCIQHIIELLHAHGISGIAATVMYKKELIEEILHENEVKIFEEKTPLGTAGSVKQCEEFVDGDFIVISGDCICDFDLTAAIEFHRSHKGIATLVLSEVTNPLEYGVCVTDNNAVITRFIEKPSWERAYSGTVNTGIYILSKEIFNYIEKDKKTDFSKDVFPLLMKKGFEIHGYRASGYWCDIGSTEAYLRCNMDILAGKTKISYPATKRVKGAELLQPCYIGKNVTAKGAVLGKFSVIGNNVTIGKGARVEKSVLLDGVNVGENAYIKNAVICTSSKIGDDASVGDYSVLGSFCVVGKGCVVSAKSRVYAKNILPVGGVVGGNIRRGIKEYDIFDIAQSPEELVALGRAFGKTVGRNVFVGHETEDGVWRAQGLSSGILNAGSDVSDLCECDKNAFAYILRKSEADGGVYVGCDRIYLYESDGLSLSHAKMRTLEKNLTADALPEKCGLYNTLQNYMPLYEQKIKKHLMGIDSVPFFVYAPEFFTALFMTEPTEISERIYIGDELGVDEYPPETVTNAVCMAYGKTYGRIYVPYAYPTTAEEIARQNGFEVLRVTLEDDDRRRIFDICDPNISGAVLLHYLVKNNMTFAELVKKLPEVHLFSREVFGADEKCNIMKRLLAIPSHNRELVEGIKFIDKTAAVHIVPQNDLHSFKIIAQAQNSEVAREICDFYVNKIKMIDNDKF